MTTLTLDRELKEVDWDDKHYPRPQIKAEVEKGCLSNNAVVSDYRAKMKTETEVVFASTVPDNAALYHKNYLGYLARTFAHHNSIVMAPQHFWYTILCEIAQTVVRNPEEHRKIFTRDPEGKIDIIVPCEDETEPLRMDDIYAEMVGLVPVDTELFLPTFSTETEMSRLASLAAFLETCSPFYNYMMYLCGHPQIKLLGTKADWELVIDRLDHLTGEFAACPDSQLPMWLNESVFPTALKLRKALDGDDPEWFKTIFTQERCGSGGETQIDGWFCRLMMQQPDGIRKITNFPTHITKVPYKIVGGCSPDSEWNLCFGLFHSDRDPEGFMVPEFSSVQVRKLAEAKVSPTPEFGITVTTVNAPVRRIQVD